MGAPNLLRTFTPARSFGGATSINCDSSNGTAPAPGTPGISYLVAIVFYGPDGNVTGAPFACTDTFGNVYTLDKVEYSTVDGVGYRFGTAIFSTHNATPLRLGFGDHITISKNSPVGMAVQVQEWTGLVGTKDVSASAAGNSSSPSSGAATTTETVELLFAAQGGGRLDTDTGSTFTQGTGWTLGTYSIVENGPFGNPNPTGCIQLDLEYRTAASAAVYTADGTRNVSAYWSVCMQAYKTAPPRSTATLVFLGTKKGHGKSSPTLVLQATARVRPKSSATLVFSTTSETSITKPGGQGPATLVLAGVGAPLYGLFPDLSVIVGRIRALGNFANANFGSDLNLILNGVKDKRILEGIYGTYDGFGSQLTAMRDELAGYCDKRLLDVDRVLRPLGLTSASIDDVFDRLGARMLEQGVSIARSTVTIGTVYPGNRNVGTGTLYLTKVLDGVTSPGEGPARAYYLGLDSEQAKRWERMTLLCTADSETDGLTAGSESFSWVGNPRSSDPMTWGTEGSGDGPTLTAAGGATLLQNSDFEDWTDDLPDSWEHNQAETVTPVKETAAANVYRGAASLKVVSGVAEVSGSIYQSIDRMVPNKRYLLAFALKAQGSTAGGSMRVSFHGTGYGEFTPAVPAPALTVPGLILNTEDMPTAWTVYSFWLNAPAKMPDDFRLLMYFTALPANMTLWVDGMILEEATYHGGIGAVLVPGRVPFLRGDKFSLVVQNDQGGSLNDFFRRRYNSQLPSSALPTFAESLVNVGTQSVIP